MYYREPLLSVTYAHNENNERGNYVISKYWDIGLLFMIMILGGIIILTYIKVLKITGETITFLQNHNITTLCVNSTSRNVEEINERLKTFKIFNIFVYTDMILFGVYLIVVIIFGILKLCHFFNKNKFYNYIRKITCIYFMVYFARLLLTIFTDGIQTNIGVYNDHNCNALPYNVKYMDRIYRGCVNLWILLLALIGLMFCFMCCTYFFSRSIYLVDDNYNILTN